MSSSEIPQPHDSLIRYTLSSPENAVSLFQGHLPSEIAAFLNWDRLRLESGSYVDEDLRRSESDLLFTVPVRGAEERDLFLYLLFEHQSTSDRWLPLRLLSYMVAIWQRQRKANPSGKLSPIVPLLLSQVGGGWRVSRHFADLLAWPDSLRAALAPLQPLFEHLLIDLNKFSKEQLQGNPSVRLVLGALKAVMEGNPLDWIEWGAPLLRLIQSAEFLQALFFYLASAESDLDLRQFAARIESANIPEATKAIMSIAERIRIEARQEGEQRGVRRGTLIGQIQALQRILKRSESTLEALESFDDGQLNAMIAQLEREL